MSSAPPRDLTPLPTRGNVDIWIEDRPVSFDVLFGNGVWAGRAAVGSHVVTVRGREFDLEALSLVRIVDLDPYVLGTRWFATHFRWPPSDSARAWLARAARGDPGITESRGT
jgi:hypothetical protein